MFEQKSLIINKDTVRELKNLYERSVSDGLETIEFQGEVILTNYAKYLVEYLEMVIS